MVLLATLSLPAEGARYTITIQNMGFGKGPTGLRVGDTIIWQNKDFLRHTATARSGAFDLDLLPGKQGQVTLKYAGEVDVFCRYHPNMTLKLMVAKPKSTGKENTK